MPHAPGRWDRTIPRPSPLPNRYGRVVVLPTFVAGHQGPGLPGRPPGPPTATPPPRARDTPPLAFKVRLDAMTTVVLDGPPYVRVGCAVGSSTSRFARACTCWARWSRSVLPAHGTFTARRAWRSLGGDSQPANRRPTGPTPGGNAEILSPGSKPTTRAYDAKRHAHTARTLRCRIHGDLLQICHVSQHLVPHQVTFVLSMAPQVFVETGSVSLAGPVGSVAARQEPRPEMSGRTPRRLRRRRALPPDSHGRRR